MRRRVWGTVGVGEGRPGPRGAELGRTAPKAQQVAVGRERREVGQRLVRVLQARVGKGGGEEG